MARQARTVLFMLWVPGLVVWLTLVGLEDRASAATAQVSIIDFGFEPASKTVSVGDTVTWTNTSGFQAHTATSNALVWDSGVLGSAGQFSFTFNTAGTYPYFCQIHGFMTGTIVVEEAPPPTATATHTNTLVPTPTNTPVVSGPPNVGVAVERAGANRLKVTLTARAGQTLDRLEWTLPPNAAAETLAGLSLPTGVTLPANTTTTSFHLRRLSGASVHLPILVHGSFGTWRTFVGGGPNAW